MRRFPMKFLPMNGRTLAMMTCLIGTGTGTGTATAQRADENAVTAAKDAFGTSIGSQDVGLYSPTDARGFSPQQAGNVRIEGLYFDQQTWGTSECMVRETTMRVGFAAQSYSFPAPTGIAEFSLRTPGDAALSSVVLNRGPFNTVSATAETQMPLIDHTLGVDLCAGYHRNFEVDMFHGSHESLFGATFRWRPIATTEIVPFWSYVVGGAQEIVPIVYTNGAVSLPQFRTQGLGAPPWTTWGWHSTTFGTVAKSTLSDQWELAAGLFHSVERDALGYQPYLTLVTTYTADSAVDVAPPFTAESTSGEMRLTRKFAFGNQQQQLQLAVRGRSVDRNFGGDAIIDFGAIPLTSQASFAQPPWALTPQSRDTTRELDLGLTYEERWLGVGSFAAGLLSDHYRRQVTVPSEPTVTDQTTPWLLNLRLEANAARDLTVYGSFVQGLEDSALAPVSASNRNEPPPATRTWQVDGGIRWVPLQSLQLILGAFEIHKPYFNLDAENLYTQLGWVQYRGLESSLSFANGNGLTILAGGVLLKPRVERTLAEPGATGTLPLGPVPLTLTANADYAPPRWGAWAVSLQWNRLSSRVETTDNSSYLPALSTLGAGVRYHLTWLAHPWSARLDGFNLTNASGLHVSSLDAVLPEQGRRFQLTLATDF